MRRSLAISLALLSPGLTVVAVTLCCAFAVSMPGCNMAASCEQKTVRSANCCASFEAGPATAAVHGAQFKPAPPAHQFVAGVFFTSAASLPAFMPGAVLVGASPPVLNLRV